MNWLGKREPDVYGSQSIAEIDAALKERAKQLNITIEVFQSNHEGELIDKIQAGADRWHGVIINPAAYTHTSVAIRDALAMLDLPIIEVHLSNIYRREAFRHHSLMAAVITGQISGLGWRGYLAALEYLAASLQSDYV